MKAIEFTVFFYDRSYQYSVLTIEETTLNNIYSGVIGKLRPYNEDRDEGDFWAIVTDQEGTEVARVKYAEDLEEYQVGIITDGNLEWYVPTLLDPDYKLIEIAYV
jgi:hypothetical protein